MGAPDPITHHLRPPLRRVSVGPTSLVQKLVFEGFIGGEELEKVTMGEGPCSICLQDLLFVGVPTRMPCSHVFHARCLLEWFVRKTTCPMCRRLVLSHVNKRGREDE